MTARVSVAGDCRVRCYRVWGTTLEDVHPIGATTCLGAIAGARHGAVCFRSGGGRVGEAVTAVAFMAVLDSKVVISGAEGCAGLVAHAVTGGALAVEDSCPHRVCFATLVVITGERRPWIGGCS